MESNFKNWGVFSFSLIFTVLWHRQFEKHFQSGKQRSAEIEAEADIWERVLGSSPFPRPDDTHALPFQETFLRPCDGCSFSAAACSGDFMGPQTQVLLNIFKLVSDEREKKKPYCYLSLFLRSSPNLRLRQSKPTITFSFSSLLRPFILK